MALYVYPPQSVSIPGVATEATLLLVETNTADTVTELQTLNTVDFATEAKQDSQITELQSINTELDTQTTALTNLNTSTDNIEADVDALNAKSASAMVTEAHDYQSIAYVGVTTRIDTITYKTGGSGGTTVATLTMGYDGSDRLTSVTKT